MSTQSEFADECAVSWTLHRSQDFQEARAQWAEHAKKWSGKAGTTGARQHYIKVGIIRPTNGHA